MVESLQAMCARLYEEASRYTQEMGHTAAKLLWDRYDLALKEYAKAQDIIETTAEEKVLSRLESELISPRDMIKEIERLGFLTTVKCRMCKSVYDLTTVSRLSSINGFMTECQCCGENARHMVVKRK